MRKRIIIIVIVAVAVLVRIGLDIFPQNRVFAENVSDTFKSLCTEAERYTTKYLDGGKTEEKWVLLAIKAALNARKLNSTNEYPHILMAIAFEAKGDTKTALERLKRAEKMAPDNQQVKKLLSQYEPQIKAGVKAKVTKDDRIVEIEYKTGKYVGNVKDGKRHGIGMFEFRGGGCYTGEWMNDRMTGHGKYEWLNGDVYVGQFTDSKKNGHGAFVYKDGTSYIGGWRDNVQEGHCVFLIPGGDVYVGQIIKNVPNGHGVTIKKDGSQYVGQFVSNQNTGHGIFVWPDGKGYVGQMQNGKPQGHGILQSTNGEMYVGSWNNGLASGGYYCWPDGRKVWAINDQQGNWVFQ